jgi:hypothetical protein
MSILKQGQLWKSSDNLYVYNIFSFYEDYPEMTLDILDIDLNWISTKYNYKVASFIDQIQQGNIINYIDKVIEDEQKE